MRHQLESLLETNYLFTFSLSPTQQCTTQHSLRIATIVSMQLKAIQTIHGAQRTQHNSCNSTQLKQITQLNETLVTQCNFVQPFSQLSLFLHVRACPCNLNSQYEEKNSWGNTFVHGVNSIRLISKYLQIRHKVQMYEQVTGKICINSKISFPA